MAKKINILILLILSITVLSCNNNIDHDDIKIENGVYANSITHEILHGKYKCEEESTLIYLEYDKGVPVNNWRELHRNELIHSGNYILEPIISNKIKKLTASFRVDLNLWSEIDYYTLNIELITPEARGQNIEEEIKKIVSNEMFQRYKFDGIRIQIVEPDSTIIKVLK